MNDIIRLLPDSVANQIAAGEVIQRPASALKELVENAVDAGATDIKVVIKDAGKTMLQVIDNGSGMSESDARMAFERHATSKIRTADDLTRLRTMGFRGEALPSICAISEVEVRTKREDAPIGTRLVIEGSRVMVQEPCVCEKGTVFTVRKLFFNTPARRKFLRSDSAELAAIMREFERLALVNNHLHMSIDTGTRQLDLPAGTLRQRIDDIWRQNLSQQLLPVNVDTSLVKIEGFVSRPEYARRRNALQFLIVNGRNMRHPAFHKAILNCYSNLIATDTQPNYFLKFEVDPDSIDVNISPTKNDVKFEYETEIFPILSAAVKATLGQNSAVPSIDFSGDILDIKPVRDGEPLHKPSIGGKSGYNPFKTAWKAPATDSSWQELYKSFMTDKPPVEPDDPTLFGDKLSPAPGISGISVPVSAETVDKTVENEGGGSEIAELAPLCMQVADKYIITSNRDGLLIIDQHRAHVKILFEEYMRRAEGMEIVSQSILFPEEIRLDNVQQSVLQGITADLEKLGIHLEYVENDVWQITSYPAMMKNSNPREVVLKILDSISEDSEIYGTGKVTPESVARSVALIMARAGAIRRGQRLNTKEMEHIVSSLFSLPEPSRTPNGNPVYFRLDADQLHSMFT